MPDEYDLPERLRGEKPVGIHEEIGATSGRTHHQVLDQTLGSERAHRNLVAGGPPLPDRETMQRLKALAHEDDEAREGEPER